MLMPLLLPCSMPQLLLPNLLRGHPPVAALRRDEAVLLPSRAMATARRLGKNSALRRQVQYCSCWTRLLQRCLGKACPA
jgi:hypothetical protein